MARYGDAIFWIVHNDDTEWLKNEEDSLSVTAALVADLFGKTDEQVRADLLKAQSRSRADPQNN